MEFPLTIDALGPMDFDVDCDTETETEYETVGTISPAGYGSEDIAIGDRTRLLGLEGADYIDEDGRAFPVSYATTPALWNLIEEEAGKYLDTLGR